MDKIIDKILTILNSNIVITLIAGIFAIAAAIISKKREERISDIASLKKTLLFWLWIFLRYGLPIGHISVLMLSDFPISKAFVFSIAFDFSALALIIALDSANLVMSKYNILHFRAVERDLKAIEQITDLNERERELRKQIQELVDISKSQIAIFNHIQVIAKQLVENPNKKKNK